MGRAKMGPLSGIKVIEAAMHHNGPAAAYMLGDLGAEVIKIEPPITGDYQRGVQSTFDNVMLLPSGHNAAFEAANRNKSSVILDLRDDAGRSITKKQLHLGGDRGFTETGGFWLKTILLYDNKYNFTEVIIRKAKANSQSSLVLKPILVRKQDSFPTKEKAVFIVDCQNQED